MSQSKTHSVIEAVVNNVIAFGISLGAQLVICPLMGIDVTLKQNIVLILIFTVISIVRTYWVRRFFNWIHERTDGARLKKEIESLRFRNRMFMGR